MIFSKGFKNQTEVPDESVGTMNRDSIVGLTDLYIPEEEVQPQPAAPLENLEQEQPEVRDLLTVLVEIGHITHEKASELRIACNNNEDEYEKYLQYHQIVDQDHILEAKASLLGHEFRRISPMHISQETIEMVGMQLEYLQENIIMPLSVDNGTLILAMANPNNVFLIDEIQQKTSMEVKPVLSPEDDITSACEALSAQMNEMDYNVDDIISDMIDVEVVQDEQEEFDDLEQMAGQSPVIKFVNYCISNAIKEGASDIHIEPKEKHTRIRYRIDGVLFDSMQSPLKMHPAVVSRIKIMSGLDISERRIPQDGKVSIIIGGRPIDLRVSILPVTKGEKVVIRVLDSKSLMLGLEDLGMQDETREAFREQIALPHGIMLVTGPTGSGKSTTLYTALSHMDGDTLNISTVEDPVEYELDFCNQVHVHDKVGMTFASALRSLLRQDPDIIMVGEIRDGETSRIAVQAALTGHLVLSTLHTNDAPSSITRMVNIGIDAYLIAASLNAVLAQRLVRKICPHCKDHYDVPDNMRKYIEHAGLDPNALVHGAGCDRCRKSGYLGRIGIYELLVMNDRFRNLINEDASVSNMRKAFHECGFKSLFDDGVQKIRNGMTTIEEVLRVTEVYAASQNEAEETGEAYNNET